MHTGSQTAHSHVELSDWADAFERPALHSLVQSVRPGAELTLQLYRGTQKRGTVSDAVPPEHHPVPDGEYRLPVTAPETTYFVISETETARHVPRVWWRTADGTLRGTFLTGLRVDSPAPPEKQLTAERGAAAVFPQLDANGR